MKSDGMFLAAGDAAQTIETVTWVLFAGGSVIFIGVMLLLAWSLRSRSATLSPRLWVVGGGVVFPAVVLVALFVYVLPRMPAYKPIPPADALIVTVKAHMWWWEVRYRDPATGADIVTANEIRIPVGRPVYFALTSADVIHSFWVPKLAGKMDMLPGRMQHLLVTATEPGTWRGQCAEFCGEQHGQMALHVIGLEPAAFDSWVAAQAKPAAVPATQQQMLGQRAFLDQRCSACHTVRGVSEENRLGPDLTHFGSRLHLGAGMLANTPEGRERWLTHIQQIKTGARMPSYDRLDPETLGALGDWLGSLQ
jgi:cytochrome c oxidase subunit 2